MADNDETPGEKITRLGSRMTLEERSFCEAYLKTQNAREAMQAAFGRTTGGPQMLGRWYVQDYITALCEGTNLRDLLVTREEVLATLADKMRHASEDRDQIRAAEVAGKFLGMATKRLEVTGKDGGPVRTEAGLDAAAVAKLRADFLGVDPAAVSGGD